MVPSNDLEAYLRAEDILAIFVKRQMISRSKTRNPEMTTPTIEIGMISGNWLGITGKGGLMTGNRRRLGAGQ